MPMRAIIKPETLTDYEEGTFTPTLVFTPGSDFTYSQTTHHYVRIGNVPAP
jgi:hypothetical protein